MRRIALVFAFILFCFDGLYSQETDGISAIMHFAGVSSEEELDEHFVEQLERLLSRPLRINQQSLSMIKESGLFTHYQIVSLEDYRLRHGDVMSLTELAALDGFGQEFTRRIAPFISLESTGYPVNRHNCRVSQELNLRGGIRYNEFLYNNYSLKYHIEAGERIAAHFALAKSSGSTTPDSYSGHIVWYFKRRSAFITIGDFNARFGQGVAMWNGLTLSGTSRPSGYLRRSTSLSPSSSYTGAYSFRGICAEATMSRLRISTMAAVSQFDPSISSYGMMPAVNVSLLCRNGKVGITHFADFRLKDARCNIPDMKTSFDIGFTIKGTDIFAEAAYDWVSASAASVAGAVFPVGEDLRLASMLRLYPPEYNPSYSGAARSLTKCSNEYSMSLSGEFACGEWMKVNGTEGFGSSMRRMSGFISLDGAYLPVAKDDSMKSHQLKALAEVKMYLSPSLSLKVRFSERYRSWDTPFRTDMRLDLSYFTKIHTLNFRLNALKCNGYGLLSYIEYGLKIRSFYAYIRQGVFRVDDWDDRIYAYERDAPGSFNVPAFYGRGLWTAATGCWKFARWGRAYFRAAFTTYPFMKEKKSGKAELKMQLKIDI